MADLTTLLSKFLADLYAGKMGVGLPATDTYFQRQALPIVGIAVRGGGLSLVDVSGASYVAFGAFENPDAWIVHEATGVLSLRHGSNAQELRIYGRHDFSVATVYERMGFRFEGGAFKIFSESATNVGAPGQPYSTKDIILTSNGLDKWQFDMTNGHVVPVFSGFFNVGAAANHVKSLYTNDLQGGYTKTLTESTATGFVTITIPSSGGVAGKIFYTVFAADATNTQIKSGEVAFAAVANSSGTVTNATLTDDHTLNPCTSGTLTNTMDATTAANAVTFRANAASSLTQTTLRVDYRVQLSGRDGTITAL